MKESNKITFKTAWNRWITLKKSTNKNTHSTAEEHSILGENKWISDLGEIMEDLKMDDFKKLKNLMRQTSKRTPIPSMRLEKEEDRCEVANLVVKTWGFKESVKAIREFMKKLPRNDEFVTDRLKPYVTLFSLEVRG